MPPRAVVQTHLGFCNPACEIPALGIVVLYVRENEKTTQNSEFLLSASDSDEGLPETLDDGLL
jgi:hypothetical protein